MVTLTDYQRRACLTAIKKMSDDVIAGILFAYGDHWSDECPIPIREAVIAYCDHVVANAKEHKANGTVSESNESNIVEYAKHAERIRDSMPKYALKRTNGNRTVYGPVGMFTCDRAHELCSRLNREIGWNVDEDGCFDSRQLPGADVWDYEACEPGKDYAFATDSELAGVA